MRIRSVLFSVAAALFLAAPSVVQAEDLVITNVTATPSSNGAVIQWTTNQPASSQVNYGLTSSYGQSTTESNTTSRVTEHSVSLVGLQSCTTYHYQARSAVLSFSVAPAFSSDATFTTTGCAGVGGTTTTTSDDTLAETGAESLLYLGGIAALLLLIFSLTQLKKQPQRVTKR